MIELFKFLLSSFLYLVKKFYDFSFKNSKTVKLSDSESLLPITKKEDKLDFKLSLYYAIPAFLYFINNNLAVYMQFYMDSATYQMLCNLKILSTSVLYYLIMKKNLSKRKWFSIVLLFLAGIFYCFGNIGSSSTGNTNALKSRIYITELGIFMIIIYTTISGLAGVYTEYILKTNYASSIHIQNMYLYSYGSMFNLFSYFLEKSYFKNSNDENSIFEIIRSLFFGFNNFTWLIIITQVFNGFVMSLVMKYSNNLTRLFLISMSLIVTVVLSVLLFSLKLNLYFYISFTTTLIAIYLYTK